VVTSEPTSRLPSLVGSAVRVVGREVCADGRSERHIPDPQLGGSRVDVHLLRAVGFRAVRPEVLVVEEVYNTSPVDSVRRILRVRHHLFVQTDRLAHDIDLHVCGSAAPLFGVIHVFLFKHLL